MRLEAGKERSLDMQDPTSLGLPSDKPGRHLGSLSQEVGWGGVGWGWDSKFSKLKKANAGLFHSSNPPVSSQQSLSASNTHQPHKAQLYAMITRIDTHLPQTQNSSQKVSFLKGRRSSMITTSERTQGPMHGHKHGKVTLRLGHHVQTVCRQPQ